MSDRHITYRKEYHGGSALVSFCARHDRWLGQLLRDDGLELLRVEGIATSLNCKGQIDRLSPLPPIVEDGRDAWLEWYEREVL